MENKIVLGSLFGDEGKGVTVQWLCQKALEEGKHSAVIRYCGGPQAGHTVEYNGIRHIFSSFGSGTLLDVPTIYQGGYIDPICFINELKVLKSKGINPKCYIGYAHVITPYDVIANRNDLQNLSDGTCGKGVYKAVTRSQSVHISMSLLHSKSELMSFLDKVRKYYKLPQEKELEQKFIECYLYIQENFFAKIEYDCAIYEGTQGLLLDANKGFLPYVTATSVIPSIRDNAEVFLVCRTYLTRHGNYGDSIILESLNKNPEKDLTNQWNEYQGEFHTGVFNIDLLNRAIDRHCLDTIKSWNYNLVLTHADYIQDNWEYIHNEQKFKVAGGMNDVCNILKSNVHLNINNYFYNDSPKGDIKKLYYEKNKEIL